MQISCSRVLIAFRKYKHQRFSTISYSNAQMISMLNVISRTRKVFLKLLKQVTKLSENLSNGVSPGKLLKVLGVFGNYVQSSFKKV